jgi:hypothetical protein
MIVSKKGRITIQPFSLMHKFYEAKQYYDAKKHKCINCKKINTLTFKIDNRTISCKCSNCTLDISFFSEKFITYDSLYDLRKKHYITARTTGMDYIQYKLDYDELVSKHNEKLDRTKQLLHQYNENKNEIITVLKETKHINNDELNDILNNIHSLTYTKLGDETIRNHSFEIEIPILNYIMTSYNESE